MHLTVSRLHNDPYSRSKFRIRFFHICISLLLAGYNMIVRDAVPVYGKIRHRNRSMRLFDFGQLLITNNIMKSRLLFWIPGFLCQHNYLNITPVYPPVYYTFSLPITIGINTLQSSLTQYLLRGSG